MTLLGAFVTGCGTAEDHNSGSTVAEDTTNADATVAEDTAEADTTEEVSEQKDNTTCFVQSLELNKEHSFDLNKDGTEETIYYNCIYDDSDEVDGATTQFTVNGVDYSADTEAIWYPSDTEFYLVDLDEKDDFVEIAITAYGPSDDLYTSYFRFDGNRVQLIGETEQHIGTEQCYGDGQGTIYGQKRVGFGTTNPIWTKYTINEAGKIEEVDEWGNYVESFEATPSHDILQEVTVYTEADTGSEKVTLNSEFGPVSLYATDCKEWISIKDSEGVVYYLHMNDGMTLDNSQDINEVLGGLVWAG